VALEFDYPGFALEQKTIMPESGLDTETAASLVKFVHMTRNLKGNGLEEAPVPVCWYMPIN
jgi:nitric oxide reductase NorQ protein